VPPPFHEPLLPRPLPRAVTYNDGCTTAQPVSSDIARDALLRYIDANQSCWGTGPAKECTIETGFWASIVCRQETFMEYRKTDFAFVSSVISSALPVSLSVCLSV
jgi:hypothetical protein